jgi:hypothetical protein
LAPLFLGWSEFLLVEAIMVLAAILATGLYLVFTALTTLFAAVPLNAITTAHGTVLFVEG